MAIVKANYVKRGRGERGRAKATIRYITHRRDRDGNKTTRTLFGFDGALTKEQVYRMINEAKRGTLFYRLILSPDPSREDTYKDLSLTDLTIDTMLALEERLGKHVQFAATLHDDHSNHRHTHLLILIHGRKLTREDFKALRLEATSQALSQRQALDLFQGREVGQQARRGIGQGRQVSQGMQVRQDRGYTRRVNRFQTRSRAFPATNQAAQDFFSDRAGKAYACPLCRTHLVLPDSNRGHRCPSCGIRMHPVSGNEHTLTRRKEDGLTLSLSS